MAFTTHLPSRSNMNHNAFSETFNPKSHSFGQVSLPKRYDLLFPSEHSLSASGYSPGVITTNIAEFPLINPRFSYYSVPKNTTTTTNNLFEVPVTVFSFGGPRVGNLEFKTRCEELGVKVLRIANCNDPITKLPGVFFNENFRVLGGKYEFPSSCSCYAHVGVELMLDFFNVQNPTCVHDLESYIGLLRRPKVEVMQPQREGVNNLLEKARELILSSNNIRFLPGILAASADYHGLLNSFSSDILCSLGDELLFGLVLCFMM
ncbi:hypothetical protein RIF29_13902 [Crotalaria pallida]|uniref:Fungal lipase-type domain-containing protein n=1 Tax=Crotalaria pallida TaxID=3830 RepID=A0AAN9FAA6_CROPI